MFWIADVFIGTNSQGWGNHKTSAEVVERPRRSKRRSRLRKGFGRSLQWLFGGLREMRERRETTQNLRRLNDHMLRDIGISRAQIEACVRDPNLRYKGESSPRVWRWLVKGKPVSARIFNNVASRSRGEADATDATDASDGPGRVANVRRAA